MDTTLLQKYWRIFWLFRRLRLMLLLEYRGNFIFWSVVSFMWTGFNYLIVGVMGSVTGEIGGWGLPQIMILVATYTILDSFTWSFFYQNMWRYTSHIYDGSLSGFLTKPIDTQFILMTQDNTFNNLPRIVIGLATLFGSIWWWQIEVSWWQWLLYFGLLSAGLAFIYSFWFLIATTAFWVERLNNIHDVLPGFRQVYQLPRTIYPGWLQILVSFVVPLALITSLPTEMFFGETNWPLVLYFLGFTIALMGVTRWFFQQSIRRYSSVGG